MRTLLLGLGVAALAAIPLHGGLRGLRAQSDSTGRQIPVMQGGTGGGYAQAGESSIVNGLHIIDVADDGTYITLQDSTTWEVYLPDRPHTVIWRKGDLVIVNLRPIIVGNNYNYELTNGRTDSDAAVKFRGSIGTP